MNRAGTTLIELLIVVAILAILSAGLLFSTTQITQRSMHSERVMVLEVEMERALDALLSDAVQSVDREIAANSATFSLAEGTSAYRLEGNRLIRRIERDGTSQEQTVAESLSAVEFTPEDRGLTVTLRGAVALRAHITERALSAFVAWPGEIHP